MGRDHKRSTFGLATRRVVELKTLLIQTKINTSRGSQGEENEISIGTDNMEANQAIQQRITATICHCGKICKNIRGLKIYQARMKCQEETSQRQARELLPVRRRRRRAGKPTIVPNPSKLKLRFHRRLRIRREIKSNGPWPRIRRFGTTSTRTSVKSLQCKQKVQ